MPIQNGKYVSPNWQNGGPPALNAAELNAICQSLQADDQQIKDNLPQIIQSLKNGVFLNDSGQLVNKDGSKITVPSGQLSDQVHIATGSYVGTGTYGPDHPCSLTFDFSPMLVIVYETGTGLIPLNVAGFWQNSFIWCPGQDSLKIGQAYGGIKQDANTIKWDFQADSYAQLNGLNTTYFYVAIG